MSARIPLSRQERVLAAAREVGDVVAVGGHVVLAALNALVLPVLAACGIWTAIVMWSCRREVSRLPAAAP